MDEYRAYAGVGGTIGVEVEFLTPEQVKEIWPLMETDGLVGAIRHPEDGYIQPADLTQALAVGARKGGGEINRNTAVTAIEKRPERRCGAWSTDKGEITCEHLVTCTGNFVRQTGEMLGLDLPVIPVEHQYIVTEAASRHSRRGTRPGSFRRWACCATPTPAGTCARRPAA